MLECRLRAPVPDLILPVDEFDRTLSCETGSFSVARAPLLVFGGCCVISVICRSTLTLSCCKKLEYVFHGRTIRLIVQSNT